MVLDVPSYLRAANIQDERIRYLWDDWNVEQAEEPIDEEFSKRMSELSQRAVIAFVNATAEWIVYRLEIFTDTTLPRQYLESGWAQIVDWRYSAGSWEEFTVKSEWSGPVQGPIGIAMTRVMYAIEQTSENAFPELRAAWITNLASYVMPDRAPYLQWREQIMKRLESYYTRDPDDTLGDVVPREALDPDFSFRPEQTELLVNRFLARLDFTTNPFLKSPVKMLERGFKGTPYLFDFEEDRRARKVL
jgi:hypothetical protein